MSKEREADRHTDFCTDCPNEERLICLNLKEILLDLLIVD